MRTPLVARNTRSANTCKNLALSRLQPPISSYSRPSSKTIIRRTAEVPFSQILHLSKIRWRQPPMRLIVNDSLWTWTVSSHRRICRRRVWMLGKLAMAGCLASRGHGLSKRQTPSTKKSAKVKQLITWTWKLDRVVCKTRVMTSPWVRAWPQCPSLAGQRKRIEGRWMSRCKKSHHCLPNRPLVLTSNVSRVKMALSVDQKNRVVASQSNHANHSDRVRDVRIVTVDQANSSD